MFCLLVVLVELSVLAKCLARKTPLRKPNRDERSSPESPGRRVRMIFLVYCIASLFYYVFELSPAPTRYIFLLLWRDIAYLCWKCR